MIQLNPFLHDLREQDFVLKLFLNPLIQRLLPPFHLFSPFFEVLFAIILSSADLINAGLNLNILPCLQSMLAEFLEAHLEVIGGAALFVSLMDHLE